MARGDLLCPICNQILGLYTPLVKQGTDALKDAVVGGHVHITMNGSFTCSNGHRFDATGDFLVFRIS